MLTLDGEEAARVASLAGEREERGWVLLCCEEAVRALGGNLARARALDGVRAYV
jgi:hypothetical protein